MIDRDVRNPTVMVGGLFPAYDPILEEIDLRGVTVAVQGDIMNPLIPMPLSLFIYHFPLICCAHGPQFLDPLEENLVVRVLGRQDKGHAVAFKDIDERLSGVETVGGDDDGQVRIVAMIRFPALTSQSCLSAQSLPWIGSGNSGSTWRRSGWTITACRIW